MTNKFDPRNHNKNLCQIKADRRHIFYNNQRRYMLEEMTPQHAHLEAMDCWEENSEDVMYVPDFMKVPVTIPPNQF